MGKRRLIEIKKALDKRLESIFNPVTINGERCFLTGDGRVFLLTVLTWADSIVVEFADSIDEARNNMFEDGSLFDCGVPEHELYASILSEIAA